MLHDDYGFLQDIFDKMDDDDINTLALDALMSFIARFKIRTIDDLESIEDVVDVRARV